MKLNEVVDQGEEENDLIFKKGSNTLWIEVDQVLILVCRRLDHAVDVEFYQVGDNVMGYPRKSVHFNLKGACDGL